MSIRGIDTDPTDRAIVKSINEIGHQTGKYTIAEFVETRHVARILQEIGIDYIQGYWVGRPMPLAKILESSTRTRQIRLITALGVRCGHLSGRLDRS